ncbi:MAG: acyl-ACP--UDP-N-acetylglucosamine O-acyltransferase [Verrucomicrobiales bacterium]|nr:acyl-ACP--UDP-N-acetylglucosamine O-acyltransferase [Verrucomicrobiales bacterium]
MIHSTAVIHPQAQVDPATNVGAYAVIDQHVVVGPNCEIGPHVFLTGRTRIGSNNCFHAGCVIGDAPQDLRYQNEPTGVVIGDHNVFREHVTIHRSRTAGADTWIGAHSYLMAHCHVAHDARLGNRVIIANGALIGGHAEVGDAAFISGNCLVHQFVRVGAFALMQGGSAISKDLPPYTVARGDNGICGLNVVGLRRAGFTIEQRLELKQLYHLLFRSKLKLSTALAEAAKQFTSRSARLLIDFVASAKRGLCADTGMTDDEE